jgi:hypothetical protein
VKDFTSRELHDAIGQALAEVSRRLASGELDQSGRFYTDAELAEHYAIRGIVPDRKPAEAVTSPEAHPTALSR